MRYYVCCKDFNRVFDDVEAFRNFKKNNEDMILFVRVGK